MALSIEAFQESFTQTLPESFSSLALSPIRDNAVPHPLPPMDAARIPEDEQFIAMTHHIFHAYETQAEIQQWALGSDDAPTPAVAKGRNKAVEKRNTVEWIDRINLTIARLNADLDAQRQALKKTTDVQIEIAEKYEAGDAIRQQKQEQGLSEQEVMEWVVASRFAQFDGVEFFADFDNSISKQKGGDPYYLGRLNGSVHGEYILQQGKDSRGKFPYAYAAVWQPAMKTHRQGFEHAGNLVELRPGVIEFFGTGAQVSILSANFEPYVRSGVSKIRAACDQRGTPANIPYIWSIGYDDIRASDKATIMIQHSAQTKAIAKAYIGDGDSDLVTLRAAHVTGVYYALKGTNFAAQLEEAGIPHFTYTDFYDIARTHQRVLEKMHTLRATA